MINFNDAQQAVGFLLPQVLRINTEVYMAKYPSYDYSQFMYVDTTGDMWDVGTVFFSGDIAGKAEFLSGAAFDMPYASVSRSQYLQTNHLAGIGYEYNQQEMERAAKIGRDLPSDKAMAAGKVAESFIYSYAMKGSTEKNATGLINDANVPVAYVAATGGGSTTSWGNKTPDQVLIDANEALNAPFSATRETQIADTLVLPTSALQSISGVGRNSNTDSTILKFVLENNFYTLTTKQPLKIKASRELETAGVGGTRRMIAYDSAREVMRFHLPGAHTFLDIFRKASMIWEVPGVMNIGGLEIRLPKGVAYRDGI